MKERSVRASERQSVRASERPTRARVARPRGAAPPAAARAAHSYEQNHPVTVLLLTPDRPRAYLADLRLRNEGYLYPAEGWVCLFRLSYTSGIVPEA